MSLILMSPEEIALKWDKQRKRFMEYMKRAKVMNSHQIAPLFARVCRGLGREYTDLIDEMVRDEMVVEYYQRDSYTRYLVIKTYWDERVAFWSQVTDPEDYLTGSMIGEVGLDVDRIILRHQEAAYKRRKLILPFMRLDKLTPTERKGKV